MSCREKGAMDCLNSWRVAFQLWGATSKNEGHVAAASGVLKHSNGKLGIHPVNEVVHWKIIELWCISSHPLVTVPKR